MNKRQVVVLWIIALVLGGAAYFAWSGKSKTYESKTSRTRGQTLLPDFKEDQVAKIEITGVKDSTSLALKDGKWTVANRDGYPAKSMEVNEFLDSLKEVKVVQGIDAEASFYPRFGMDPASDKDAERGLDVVMSNAAGSEVGRFTFGKNLQAEDNTDPMSMMMGGGGSTGRYVRNHADSTGVYSTKEVFPTLNADPKSWLDPKFVQLEKIKDISVSAPAKPEETVWKLTRADEGAEFTLEGAKEGETPNAEVTTPLKTLFSYARFEDVASADTLAKEGHAADKRTVKIDTVEGFHYTLGLTPPNPAKPEAKEGEAAAPPEDIIYLTVDVTADIAAERKKEEKETPEDAKAKDAAFTERKTALEKKLAEEKKLAGRVFKLNRSAVEPLLKDRAGLTKPAESTPPPAAAGGLPQGFPGAMPGGLPPGAHGGLPGGAVPRPASPPKRRPVEATTPPIAIPPMDERPAPTPKPDEVKPEQPRPDESKPEAPKPDETKPEQPKAEEAPPVEQPKPQETPPVEQPKPQEAPPVEQAKPEGQ